MSIKTGSSMFRTELSNATPKQAKEKPAALKRIKYKRKFTIEQKLKFVELLNKNTVYAVSKIYGIDRKTLRVWKKKKNLLVRHADNQKYRLDGAGRHNILSADKQKEILAWIKTKRMKGEPVSSGDFVAYARTNFPELKYKTTKQMKYWCRKFLNTQKLFTTRISASNECYSDCDNRDFNHSSMIEFLKDVECKRKLLSINDEGSLNCVIKADEIEIGLENFYKENLYKTDCEMRKLSLEKRQKIWVILGVTPRGDKLPPLIVFKGDPKKAFEKSVPELTIFDRSFVYSYFQKNGSIDCVIFRNWIENVFLNYERVEAKKKCLLLMDKTDNHLSESMVSFYKQKMVIGALIPYELSSEIVELKYHENLKNAFFKRSQNFILYNPDKAIDKHDDLPYGKIIELVNDIWYDDSVIRKEIISYYFKKYFIIVKKSDSGLNL